MPPESTFAPLTVFATQHVLLIQQLYVEGKCAKWQISIERFSEALRRSAEKRFPGAHASARDVEAYLKSLHLEDLALACACSDGLEEAWEFFVAHFRHELRAAAGAIL